MDVGQGDAIFIESPTGVQIIIDGGPDNSILRELPKLMSLSDRQLDAAIATHPDADHIAGFVDLLRRYSVGVFIEPGIPKPTVVARALEKEIDTEKIPRYVARRGAWLELGHGARLDILFPDFDVSHLSSDKTNEGCIVSHLVYGNTSMIFMCDAPGSVEDYLMQISSSTELKSDILKVGHHGSRSSTGNVFLDEVDPALAIISVGARNTYGHPTGEVLGRLESYNIETLRTDQEGTIVFVSNGKEFVRTK
ncbi:MAG: competence protein ComEC [Parcubacteria group bacterium Gr01-1014_56]|nr:MAG: competence protein ComEC [Parcubacteria group bacterium Gr01-1014_56]